MLVICEVFPKLIEIYIHKQSYDPSCLLIHHIMCTKANESSNNRY